MRNNTNCLLIVMCCMIWCVIAIMKGMKALLQVQAAGIPLTLVLFVDLLFIVTVCLLWPPYGIGQAIIFCPVVSFFFLLLQSFFSSPNLSGYRLDVYHTSTHSVALAPISNAGLKCAARGSLEIQDAKKSPF